MRGLLAASAGVVEMEMKKMGYRNARKKCMVTLIVKRGRLKCP